MEKNEVRLNGELFEKEFWNKNVALFYWQGDQNFYAMREVEGKIIEWWFYSDGLPDDCNDIIIFRTGKKIRMFSEEEFWRRIKLRAFQ